MILQLTQKGTGKPVDINTEVVKFYEVDADGVSTHVVFGESFVRVVNESLASIRATIGSSMPVVIP